MGQFCYWDGRSLGDTIILIVLAFSSIIIGSITAQRLRKRKYLGEYGKKIIIIYILIIAWCTIMCSQCIYSIIVYFVYLYQNPTESIEPFARNYVRFDILPGFIVQTIFLTICRFYYKGITGAIEISYLSKWERNYINYLNFYYFFRVLAQAVGITLVNIYAKKDEIFLFSQINIWILIFDSVIMNIYLILSLRIYLKAMRYIKSMSEKEIKTLKIEYSLMIATSLMRVVIDIIFLIIPLFQGDEKSQQVCLTYEFTSHLMTAIFYNIIGNAVNHLLPIIWILKIYSYKTNLNGSDNYSQMDDPIIRSCLQ